MHQSHIGDTTWSVTCISSNVKHRWKYHVRCHNACLCRCRIKSRW